MLRSLLIVSLIALSPAVAVASDTTALKTQLQAAMQRTQERSLVDGAIVNVDLETGESEQLYPTEAHPMILTMGDMYVMCATLRTESGEKRLVDYYLAQDGKRFKLVRTEIENRKPLQALIKAGVAKRLK
ncbi:MAG: hypothetical protein ACPGGK_06480 [Pikeienuella sp.]